MTIWTSSVERQQLIGKIQKRYGTAKEAADRQADEFVKSLQIEQEKEKKDR
jgi:hypothetical protein